VARATARLKTATIPEVAFTPALISGLSLLGAWRKKQGISKLRYSLKDELFLKRVLVPQKSVTVYLFLLLEVHLAHIFARSIKK
jgi:hypothetical protein